MALAHLSIKNFREFQHYHDERPVAWIKLYTAILDDYDFQVLPEVQQAQLVKLWLLAARMKNRIPADPAFIRAKIGAKGRLYLEELTAAGWLLPATDAPAPALDDSGKDSRETLENIPESSSPRALAREEERREEKRRGEKPRRSRPDATPKPRESWMAPLATAYEDIFGAGTFAAVAGEFAKYWRTLVVAHGGEKCAAVLRWAHDADNGTERDRSFRSPKYIAAHFGTFDPTSRSEIAGEAA